MRAIVAEFPLHKRRPCSALFALEVIHDVIDGNAVNPGVRLGIAAERIEMLVHFDEDLLYQIACNIFPPHKPVDKIQHALTMIAVQLIKIRSGGILRRGRSFPVISDPFGINPGRSIRMFGRGCDHSGVFKVL